MTFEPGQHQAAVWLRLPGQHEPVVCGRVSMLRAGPDSISDFVYGRSYLEREQAMPLVPHDLPLEKRVFTSRRGLHGVLRDAAPDAWGRRVLHYHLRMTASRADAELTEIDYLLASSQRLGALHFQHGVDRLEIEDCRLEPDVGMLAQAARAVESDEAVDSALVAALLHGTSVGGARPKALVRRRGKASLAKFSSTTDRFPVVRLEALALELARACGLEVPGFELIEVLGKDSLLVDRFDIVTDSSTLERRHFFSTLTALGLDEMEARYASYLDLADYLRRFAAAPVEQCRQLFSRMVFNILIGNTDDHARNHALFWDGLSVQLTPAYDLCVMPRSGGEASQAMEVGSHGNRATVTNAISQCQRFGLNREQAERICREMIETIIDEWPAATSQAQLPKALSRQLLGSAVLAQSALEGL